MDEEFVFAQEETRAFGADLVVDLAEGGEGWGQGAAEAVVVFAVAEAELVRGVD